MHRPSLRETWELLRDAGIAWWNDDCLRLGASLAYYTLFSIAPLLLIAIAIVALVFGDEIANGEVMTRIEELVGADGAETIRSMVESASQPRSGILATISGLVMTVIGASSVFGQLQYALNGIWRVPASSDRGLWAVVVDRLTSLSMILVIGFLLLVSLALGALVTGFSGMISQLFPGAVALTRLVDVFGSFAVTTLLFAMIFKVLPDADIRWGDVWIGAAFTSLLFAVGRLGIALYLGYSSASSVYGAASSLIVVLLWIYYSSQLLFYGAECTHVYATRFGSRAGGSSDEV